MNDQTVIDKKIMRRALGLAERGAGWVAPNPLVGAVLVKDNKIIGEGWHARYGEPHAEVNAIADARAKNQNTGGATLYVTLEPCNHQGKTPPCTAAIIAAEIERVVYAASDPNPHVTGGGGARLHAAGIKVDSGVEEAAAREQNKTYLHWITTGTPYVLIKVAVSADNKITQAAGRRTQITGAPAQYFSHALRQRYGAVLIGAGTVLADNPALTVRFPLPGVAPRQPLRIILDGQLRTPSDARVLTDDRCLIITANNAPDDKQRALANQAGVITLPAAPSGRVPLAAALAALAARQITSVLVEGGADVMTQFWEAGLANEWIIIRSTEQFGTGVDFIADPPRFTKKFFLAETQPCGPDTIEFYRPLT